MEAAHALRQLVKPRRCSGKALQVLTRSFHGSTMLPFRASSSMPGGRQIREKSWGTWTRDRDVCRVLPPSCCVPRNMWEPSPRAPVSDARGGGYAMLDTTMSAGEVLELTRFLERCRFRSILLRPATILSAEARAGRSASHFIVPPDFQSWIGAAEPQSRSADAPRVPASASFPRCSRRIPARRRQEARRSHPQSRVPLSVHAAPQSLSLTILLRQSRGFSGRQLVGNYRRDYTLNALCGRACAFFLAADVSWVRQRVSSGANAADVESRLVGLGHIRPSEALGAWQIRKRITANDSRDRHHFVTAQWPEPRLTFTDHFCAGQTDTVTNRTDALSCLHHRVQSACEPVRFWSFLESCQHSSPAAQW